MVMKINYQEVLRPIDNIIVKDSNHAELTINRIDGGFGAIVTKQLKDYIKIDVQHIDEFISAICHLLTPTHRQNIADMIRDIK